MLLEQLAVADDAMVQNLSSVLPAAEQLSASLSDAFDLPSIGPYVSEGAWTETRWCFGARRQHWVAHTHPEHELFWGVRGTAAVLTATALWIVPPGMALWIPAGMPHELHIDRDTTLKCTFIRPDARLPWRAPRTISLATVIGELLVLLDDGVPRQLRRRIEQVVLDLLSRERGGHSDLPIPSDPRLVRAVKIALSRSEDHTKLDVLGAAVGMSVRTFTRRFRLETGLSFREWYALARVRAATALLDESQPLSRIAHQAGYRTKSGFISAFRRATGRTPGDYRRDRFGLADH